MKGVIELIQTFEFVLVENIEAIWMIEKKLHASKTVEMFFK
jgi:hypothetical protein